MTRVRPSTRKGASARRAGASVRSSGTLDAASIRATQAIYAAAMLEELKLFQVADRLVELFRSGALPIGRGRAGSQLYQFTRTSSRRLSSAERLSLYARTLGVGGGDAGGRSNREFGDLWARFVSGVAALTGPDAAADLVRLAADVRGAGRDLAANLSAHGYGVAYYAARELAAQIKLIMALLSAPEVRSAFGARDLWQVVDQVAALHLGGASNIARYRAMATAGSTIIAWLARRARDLERSSTLVLKIASAAPRPRLGASRPTDGELVAGCETWLSAAAIP